MTVYRNCVESNLVPRVKDRAICSLKFKNYMVRLEKNPNSISDKVSVCADGGKVLHGHYFEPR